MQGALTLPEGRPATREAAPSPAEVRARVATALAEAGRLVASDDAVEAAIGRLLAQYGGGAEVTADGIATRLAEAGSEGTALYRVAGLALDEGREAEALALLAALAATPEGRPDAILGLAVCAARLSCYDDALVLAGESRRLMPEHPRACCIAGLCEIERGDHRAAQGHLATAARIARRNPAHREDLRMAQRMLLLMHLS